MGISGRSEFSGIFPEEVQGSRGALDALHTAVLQDDETKQSRAWKLISVLPLWLLLGPGSQGRVGRDELGASVQVVRIQRVGNSLHAEATQVPERLPRQRTLTPEQRTKTVCQKIRVGEVSRARPCLTGATLAPGTQEQTTSSATTCCSREDS